MTYSSLSPSLPSSSLYLSLPLSTSLSLGFRRPFSLRQDRYEFPNFQEESAVSEHNPSSDTATVASTDLIAFQGKKKKISRKVKGFYSHCCQAAVASERSIRVRVIRARATDEL